MTSKLQELAEDFAYDWRIDETQQCGYRPIRLAPEIQKDIRHRISMGYKQGFLTGARMAWEAARRRTPIDTDNEITLERLTYLNLNNWLKTMEE